MILYTHKGVLTQEDGFLHVLEDGIRVDKTFGKSCRRRDALLCGTLCALLACKPWSRTLCIRNTCKDGELSLRKALGYRRRQDPQLMSMARVVDSQKCVKHI